MSKSLKNLLPQKIKNLYHLLAAFVSAAYFRFPARKMTVIGVTGTDGKTTTSAMLHHILASAGLKVSMITTVKTTIAGKDYPTGFHVTTPDSFRLQKFLKKMVDAGTKIAIVEMTSHALDQSRVAFVPVHTALITNITPEHLDYHKTFDTYVGAKAKILKNAKFRILNIDDASFARLRLNGSGQLFTFGLRSSADYRANEVAETESGISFKLHSPKRQKLEEVVVKLPLIGRFNVYNALAAITAATTFDIDAIKAAEALASFNGVEGRMQLVDEGQDFFTVVDFAHTPAAMESVLKSFKYYSHNKMIIIFGAPGERDRGKRAAMGKLAAKLADYAIFTTDDPRSEKPEAIIDQIASGADQAGGIFNQTYWKIADRQQAINLGIKNLAHSGDIVAILGMGHEDTINIGGKEIPWNDTQAARKSLRERLHK